ncbi:MAG: cysteine--tRNA ligase [Patescibacteria group bacterium]|nr:cysteine--tRNA ligase [Patescibacteria group bacterium]
MFMVLYNTLDRKKEIFKPIKNRVGLYSCGPTVYNYAHIGNLRAYVFADILKKTLKYNGYKVKHVMNITDVGHLTSDADFGEDKMIKALRREGKKFNKKSIKKISKFYTRAFKQDIKKLNIQFPNLWTKATAYIKEMIKMIRLIEKNGYAYETSDGLYFNTAKLPDYGKLAQLNIKGLQPGARVEINPEKKNLTDFALWFKAVGKGKSHLMQWASPWGKGWPGWHIECSAMSSKCLGQPFDIHTGGIDHIPVHHTNEIAQAEAARKKPLAHYWLHNEFLILDKEKMAKSGEGFITLSTLANKGFNPLAYRYFCLTAHYRSPLNFNWENLLASQNALNNLYQNVAGYPRPTKINKETKQKFTSAINDDLDTPQALSVVWETIKSDLSNGEKMATLIDFDKILGLDLIKTKKDLSKIPLKIKEIVKKRELFRKEKNWAAADQLRQEINNLGFQIEDTAQGTFIKKNN